MEEAFPEINFSRLRSLAAKWAKECTPYINEISFYETIKSSNYKYLIDIVVNDPPKIEPELGYIGAGHADYLLELSEVRKPPAESFKDIKYWGNLWDIDARWQTSGPNPYVVDDPKLVLYKRKEPLTFEHTFAELKIDKLKESAQEWAIDFKRDLGVTITAIFLYKYRPSIHIKRVARKYKPEWDGIFPAKYAIVFEFMHYEWKNLSPEERSNIEDPYANFIYRETRYMDAGEHVMIPDTLKSGFDGVYQDPTKKDFDEEWVFLPRCKNIELIESVRVNEGFVVLFDVNDQSSMDNYFNWCKEMQPDPPYYKDFEIVVAERDEKKERAVWGKFIHSITEAYGICGPDGEPLQYEYFSEPGDIKQGGLLSMIRQLMGFCMWLNPAPKDPMRSENYSYFFIKDVINVFKQNKKYFPDKGSADLNSYMEDLKRKFQNLIDDIYDNGRLPFFLEALSMEAEKLGIKIKDSIDSLNEYNSEGICPQEKFEQDKKKVTSKITKHTNINVTTNINYYKTPENQKVKKEISKSHHDVEKQKDLGKNHVDDLETVSKQNVSTNQSTPADLKPDQIDKIKNLTIRYENNSEISIQEIGKQKETVSANTLKFKRVPGKTWNIFLEVLQDYPEFYFRLRSRDKKIKDNIRGLLKQINSKLLNYFNEIYDINPPDGYKLYEIVKGKGSGLYKFKFKISLSNEKSNYSKKRLRDKFFTKYKEFEKTNERKLSYEIQELGVKGLENGWLSKKEIKENIVPIKSQNKQNTPKGTRKERFTEGYTTKTDN